MSNNNKKEKILVIVAHRDDEVLGCGATLARYAQAGYEIGCLTLGSAILCRKSCDDIINESNTARKIIGIKHNFTPMFAENVRFPDNKFDSVPLFEIITEIEAVIKTFRPNIIFTHDKDDLNIDHKVTYKAVITACRPCNIWCPKRVYSFEVLSSTEWNPDYSFVPNVFINVDNTIQAKVKAMEAYKSELRKYPHPRSKAGILYLAFFRGMQSGMDTAEAFKLIRLIQHD